MELCSYNDALSAVPILREEYQKNNQFGIVKDVLAILYDSKEDKYSLTFNMVTNLGKVLSLGWPIDNPISIPEQVRKKARMNPDIPISFKETSW
jgi:hypothetical protein